MKPALVMPVFTEMKSGLLGCPPSPLLQRSHLPWSSTAWNQRYTILELQGTADVTQWLELSLAPSLRYEKTWFQRREVACPMSHSQSGRELEREHEFLDSSYSNALTKLFGLFNSSSLALGESEISMGKGSLSISITAICSWETFFHLFLTSVYHSSLVFSILKQQQKSHSNSKIYLIGLAWPYWKDASLLHTLTPEGKKFQ